MSETEGPLALTQERYNCFARALESLFDHQKSLATLVAGGQRDVVERLRRVEDRLSAVESRLSTVEQTLHDFRSEHASQMNQILNAQQTAFRADMRLDRLEDKLKTPRSDA